MKVIENYIVMNKFHPGIKLYIYIEYHKCL